MVCTLEELRCKDVINIVNGENLGRVDDLQMDANSATVTALICMADHAFRNSGAA